MDATLHWYQENAEDFIARTSEVDMSASYERFLAHIAPGGKIMDLGCGAGSASLYFMRHGYHVVPVDGCKELCDAVTKRTGLPARNILFAQLDYQDEFDGIWACASLLHVPKTEMAHILSLVKNALKRGGSFYASYKYGTEERTRNGRFFSDYTMDAVKTLFSEAGGFEIMQIWLTADARPDRAGEHWVNVICRKL